MKEKMKKEKKDGGTKKSGRSAGKSVFHDEIRKRKRTHNWRHMIKTRAYNSKK